MIIPRVNVNCEVRIVTLIYATEKSAGVSSLHPGDVVEARNWGNCTTKVRILRGGKALKFGVKTSQPGGKIDMAINMANHEELNFFNAHGSITEEFVMQLLLDSFSGLWFQGEMLPESNSHLVRYKILDVMQQEKLPADLLTV